MIKKILALLLSATMVVSMAACGDTDTPSSDPVTGTFTAGKYQSVQKGMMGDLKVDVTFTSDTIAQIDVVEHSETEGLSDPAIINIPATIVEYQSLAVDAVSGATVTSTAVMNGVIDCVTQAGGDVETLKAVEINEVVSTETVSKTADVVIVGGGGAGLSAAVEAAREGSSVVLIETNAYLGGNTVRTAGATAIVDSERASTNEITSAQMADLESLVARETDEPVVKEWQKKVAEDMVAYKEAGKIGLYDSAEFTALQFYFRFGESAIPERLYEMTAGSTALRPWLAGMDFPWSEDGQVIVGDNWPRWYVSDGQI